MLINNIEKYFDVSSLKEDARKIGINLTTAGTAGLFLTHIAGSTSLVILSSIWVITMGLCILLLGLYRGK